MPDAPDSPRLRSTPRAPAPDRTDHDLSGAGAPMREVPLVATRLVSRRTAAGADLERRPDGPLRLLTRAGRPGNCMITGGLLLR